MLLSVNNVSYKFGDKNNFILKDINLSLEKGEFVLVKGPSGSGKTTLLFLCGSLLFPNNGTISFSGIQSSKDNELKFRSQIGFVFQDPILFENETVMNNFFIMGRWNGVDLREIERKSTLLLSNYGMIEFQNQFIRNLSGGQKQRISLISALILNPKLLLLDEPLGSIDSDNKNIIIKDIQSIKDQ